MESIENNLEAIINKKMPLIEKESTAKANTLAADVSKVKTIV